MSILHKNDPKLIVLTGGPGAGKTTVLDMAKRMFCDSDHVMVLHEAASMLYNGGFIRRDTQSATRCAQRAIYHIQREQERILEEDRVTKLGLCDRGTLDGLAYWPGKKEEFLEALGTTEQAELARYAMIIHMRTPPEKHGYDNSNPARTEDSEEAAILDQRTLNVWRKHPNLFIVDSRQNFLHKAEEVVGMISKFI